MRIFTGSNGDLGKVFENNYKTNTDKFYSKKELDITKYEDIKKLFKMNKNINSFINFAAYTNVFKSESEKKKSLEINAVALENLCEILNEFKVKLYHISTDYVFNNKNKENYEKDFTNPINYYGYTKMMGENIILKKSKNYSIIRTSLLFSKYENNYVKKIQKIIMKDEKISINNDIGCPTSCLNFSNFINEVSKKNYKTKEILHYRDYPNVSRLTFTKKIIKIIEQKYKKKYKNRISIINNYDEIKRPKRSILNCNLTFEKYRIEKKKWIKDLNNII